MKVNETQGQSEDSDKAILTKFGPVNESTNQAKKLIQAKSDQSSLIGPNEEFILDTKSQIISRNFVYIFVNLGSICLQNRFFMKIFSLISDVWVIKKNKSKENKLLVKEK